MKALLTGCAAILASAIVALATAGSVGAASSPPESAALSESTDLRARIWSSTEKQVLQLHNQARATAGLGPLTGTNALGKAAAKRCTEIISKFSHTRPNGTSWSTVLQQFRISYRVAGENIAYGYSSANSVHTAWMNSSGHRANILRSSFKNAGVGQCTNSAGTQYWVVLFVG